MGFAKVLYLKNTAVPSVYTVGAPQSTKPLTRDVGCQCTAPISKKSISVQASFPIPKPKRRSKAIQVKCSGHPVISSSENDSLQTPELITAPIKRPRMEENRDELNDRSLLTLKEPNDFTYEPDLTEDDEK
ncbi:THAP domain-containing 10-like isoform X2 [Labeo rohita]|nr:THAP domain-containing 10-like isoform X2 [Labeo rohita]RXN15382.1 THAP domain-containing 10-like isoform X2 [Labeo rohita]